MIQLLTQLWQDEAGQDAAEYVMLIALIAVVIVGAVTAFGNEIKTALENATNNLFGSSS